MVVQVEFPELEAPAKILLGPERRFGEEAYWAFCVANPNLRSELNANGEIVIVPPAGGESEYRSADISSQLFAWARRDGRGKAFGSSGGFTLPSGAVYAPDAAWVSNARLSTLTKEQRRKFIPLAPDFVVEVLSPSDRLPAAKAKAQEWLDGGSALVWLIDGDHRTVWVYRQGSPMASTFIFADEISELVGEGPVEGFLLNLDGVWEGL